MRKQLILRTIVHIIFCMFFLYATLEIVSSKVDILVKGIMVVTLIVIVIYTIVCFVKKIMEKTFEFYEFQSDFEYLKEVHNERYKAYLSNNSDKIEKYSAEIDKMGFYIICLGENYLDNNMFDRCRNEEIVKILAETQKMMNQIKD